MNIRTVIAEAIRSADDRVRQYGTPNQDMADFYADVILERVGEIAGLDEVEKILSEHARYKRALEYIAKAPVSTETEIVLQGRAMIGLLDKGEEDDDD